ncbi:MAG: hypothetical protein OQL19_16595 [Gammaproteobacteria bacterium]|nr:hypothetical protein [Gammaproteobacteria bacterium]
MPRRSRYTESQLEFEEDIIKPHIYMSADMHNFTITKKPKYLYDRRGFAQAKRFVRELNEIRGKK